MRARAVVALAALALLPARGVAQEPGANGFSVGMARTQAEQAVVRLVVNVLRDVNLADQQVNEPNWLLFFTPEIDLATGAEDAFSSITARLSATLVRFDTVVVEGITTPKSDFFHMLPVAAGLEANRDFSTVNGLLELGYIPWFQGAAPPLLKTLRVGVFLQAGYKFDRDTPVAATGGAAPLPDASAEAEDDLLGRVRGSVRWSPRIALPESNVHLVSAADVWADVLNGELYYRLEGTLRLKLFADQYLDLTWERGAGAPNFNQGSQFSANLRITY